MYANYSKTLPESELSVIFCSHLFSVNKNIRCPFTNNKSLIINIIITVAPLSFLTDIYTMYIYTSFTKCRICAIQHIYNTYVRIIEIKTCFPMSEINNTIRKIMLITLKHS